MVNPVRLSMYLSGNIDTGRPAFFTIVLQIASAASGDSTPSGHGSGSIGGDIAASVISILFIVCILCLK